MTIFSPKKKRKFIKLKSKVMALRKLGKTYSEIRKIYNIPKSTLSDWLKGVKMSLKERKRLQKRAYKNWRRAVEANAKRKMEERRKIRLEIENNAKKEIKKIEINDLKPIGAALYWAEGGKNRNQLRFSNSDPAIIKVITKFFCKVCKIPKEKIKARVHIYPGMDYQKCLNFWSKITKLPKSNFHPPQIQISRASKGKRPRNTLPYGTLHLTVTNTELACRVKGWIQGISEKI